MGRGSSKASKGGGGGDKSIATFSMLDAREERIAELQEQLENTAGMLRKAVIKREIDDLKEMTEKNFEGTLQEYRAIKQAEKDEEKRRLAQENEARRERERIARENAEKARQAEIEREMQTQPKEKVEQFKIIQENNPMLDDDHVGIRKPSEIKTWAEAMRDEDSFAWGDFSLKDAQNALKKGTIKIYSSYPIKQGVFVSTSKRQAEEYAGGQGKKVYTKTVPLGDVAWINADEGQFAKIK